jgi:hypothetical protein
MQAPAAMLTREPAVMLMQEPVASLVRGLELGIPAWLRLVKFPAWWHKEIPIRDNKTDLLKSIHATVDESNHNVPNRLLWAVHVDHSEKDHS